MKAARLLALLAVAGCAMPDEGSRRDQVGNIYPMACRGDLSALEASATFVMVPYDDPLLRDAAKAVTATGYRTVLAARYPGGAIFIDDRLTGWKLEDAKRHELCHVLLGAWHK